jgi:hypothetical protein
VNIHFKVVVITLLVGFKGNMHLMAYHRCPPNAPQQSVNVYPTGKVAEQRVITDHKISPFGQQVGHRSGEITEAPK